MIVGAFPIAGGIQVNRQIDANTLSSEMVMPGDAGWLDAVRAAAQFGSEVATQEPPAPTLASAQSDAIAGINAVRGEVRRKFLTDLPGQSMVYAEKEREAREWVAARASGADEPDPSDYPHLLAECGITAPDMDDVAQVYLNMAALFRQVSAVIEATAMAAIGEVETALTPEAASAAAEAFPHALATALFDAGFRT